jgi:amino acid transporter
MADSDSEAVGKVGTADWPAEAAHRVETIVTGVRDRTVRPLTTVAKAVVFGILVAVLTLIALALVTVAVVRILNAYAFTGREWATYTLIGGIFTLLGAFLWLKRRSKR